MAHNLILGFLIGIITYVTLFEGHILAAFRYFTGDLDAKNDFLLGINTEKTCLELRSKLGMNGNRLEGINANYYWVLLSCSKILSYTSMEKVGPILYYLP